VRERLAARVARERREAPRSSRWPILLAAGLAGVVAAGGVALWARRDTFARQAVFAAELETLRSEVETIRAERDEADGELAENEARLRQLESDLVLAEKVIAVLGAEHMESLAIAGTAEAPGAKGRVFWDWDEWYCYARIDGLAKDPEKIYAMWLFTEDDVIGVGTFRADEAGRAMFLAPVPHDVGVVLKAGVSIEPDEDLGTKPRGAVVLLGEAI
jgi:outer membrane murein-binding lipoprotein Lpp